MSVRFGIYWKGKLELRPKMVLLSSVSSKQKGGAGVAGNAPPAPFIAGELPKAEKLPDPNGRFTPVCNALARLTLPMLILQTMADTCLATFILTLLIHCVKLIKQTS